MTCGSAATPHEPRQDGWALCARCGRPTYGRPALPDDED